MAVRPDETAPLAEQACEHETHVWLAPDLDRSLSAPRRPTRQHSKALEYPNGTRSATHGQASATFALNPRHRYAARVTGQGAYKRPNPVLAGSVGYFQRTGAPAPFFDQSECL